MIDNKRRRTRTVHIDNARDKRLIISAPDARLLFSKVHDTLIYLWYMYFLLSNDRSFFYSSYRSKAKCTLRELHDAVITRAHIVRGKNNSAVEFSVACKKWGSDGNSATRNGVSVAAFRMFIRVRNEVIQNNCPSRQPPTQGSSGSCNRVFRPVPLLFAGNGGSSVTLTELLFPCASRESTLSRAEESGKLTWSLRSCRDNRRNIYT